MIKRSVRIAGHATSVALEAEFWQALEAIAHRRQVTVGRLLAEVDAVRSSSLASAIRVFVLDRAREGEL